MLAAVLLLAIPLYFFVSTCFCVRNLVCFLPQQRSSFVPDSLIVWVGLTLLFHLEFHRQNERTKTVRLFSLHTRSRKIVVPQKRHCLTSSLFWFA